MPDVVRFVPPNAKLAHRLYYLLRGPQAARQAIYYQPAGLILNHPFWRLGDPAWIIGWQCETLGLPKITALLVGDSGMPGPGFFDHPENFREPISRENYASHVLKVYAATYPDLSLADFHGADTEAREFYAARRAA